jgi:hypothetical protein
VTDPLAPGARRWTLEEATAALAWVAERMTEAKQRLDRARTETATTVAAVKSNGHGSLPADLTPVREILEELNAAGIVVRDIDRGLIDFPAVAPSGRTYLLCWLAGEATIEWWHWPEDGFAGRMPLDSPPQ